MSWCSSKRSSVIPKPESVLLATLPNLDSLDRSESVKIWCRELAALVAKRLSQKGFATACLEMLGNDNLLTAATFLHSIGLLICASRIRPS